MSCLLYAKLLFAGLPVRPVKGIHGVPTTEIIRFDMSQMTKLPYVPLWERYPEYFGKPIQLRDEPSPRSHYVSAAKQWASNN